MNPSQLFRRLIALFAFGLGSLAFAQTASLQADTAVLSPAGGVVKLTASVSYDGEPGAVAWQLFAPAGWTYVSLSGPQAPQISPRAGTAGTFEFAYTQTPDGKAEFSIVVRYPAGAITGRIAPKVLIRSGGKLTTLEPAAVEWKN